MDLDEFREVQISPNDLSIVQLNIRGLIGKQDKLLKFLNSSNKEKIDIVIVSETWLTKSSEKLINIPRYDLISEVRQNKYGGGVGILINKKLKYKTRLELCNSSFEKNCFVEIKTKTKNLLVGSLYRPPNTKQKDFTRKIVSMNKKLLKEHNKSIILGMDHNMDFLKNDKNKETQTFIETILEPSLFPVTTRPMRVTKSTATLIDNIIVSRDLYPKSHSAILIEDFSDHLPCIAILKEIKSLKGEMITLAKRDTKPELIDKVNSDLQQYDWPTEFQSKTVSKQFEIFHNRLMDSLNRHCPEWQITVSGKSIIREPWLTKSLINCLHKQKLLYKTHLINNKKPEGFMQSCCM